MEKLVVVDGNSIINRAFYGIMGNKMLMTNDGTYTNGVYGFLAILFKILDDIKPQYLVVAFDLKKPTKRHELYKEYKATRHGMPDELASQMPILKEILQAMNITIIEKEGYEADDILGTFAMKGSEAGIQVTLLTGDRDAFQLARDNVIIRIPRTKMGKTEEEDFNKEKIKEVYGINPKQLIEVKGLMGDASDNIPGVPGVGEKTAIDLINRYNDIDNLYKNLDEETSDIKGKLKEKLIENRELAYLSRTLGTIDTKVPIEKELKDVELKEWNFEEVLNIFKELKFSRFIERFNLSSTSKELKKEVFNQKEIDKSDISNVLKEIRDNKSLVFYLNTISSDTNNVLNKKINGIDIYNEQKDMVYNISITQEEFVKYFKEIFEDNNIIKVGFKVKETYILLKQLGIETYISLDIELIAYLLNSNNSKYNIESLDEEYLQINANDYLEDEKKEKKNEQITMFDNSEIEETITQKEKEKDGFYCWCIGKLKNVMLEKLKQINGLDLLNNIEMPTAKSIAYMQYAGIYVDKEELIEFGKKLEDGIQSLVKEIYVLCGEEFNINSPKQLGEMLFEKLQLPMKKKTKTGYSTDVDILEKLKNEHPVIEKILEYRQLMKLNSTYVVGMLPYINENTKRIHSYFHQTVTSTGRISSTEPNLQNIPTRVELGKQLRKVFKSQEGKIYLDADYSQIELRVLAHISEDENMIQAFNNDEDIHAQAASKVFNIPLNEVTSEERSKAKAVNFGIVYGISDFGLSEQIGVSKKEAQSYIDQYLEKYQGIKKFMDDIVEKATKQGYVETLFNRRRYIPELSSNNYMVRQFGKRVALNTPIQGTAADIIKIAMINVDKELNVRNLKSKIVLQIHDELLLEVLLEEKEIVKKILKDSMENVIKLKIPLKVEISEATNWYEAK